MTKIKQTYIPFARQGDAMEGPSAPPSLSDDLEPATLSFSSQEDALNFGRHCAENSKNRLILQHINLVDSYREGEIDIVVNFSTGPQSGECDLVFRSIVDGGKNIDRRDNNFKGLNDHPAKKKIRGNYRGVKRMTQLVEGPKGVIPSLVWLERTKKRHDFAGKVFASAFNHVVQLVGTVGYGEVAGLLRGVPNGLGNAVPDLIKGGSQRFQGNEDAIVPTSRNAPIEPKLDELVDAIRIRLNDFGVCYFFEKSIKAPFERVDITLAAA